MHTAAARPTAVAAFISGLQFPCRIGHASVRMRIASVNARQSLRFATELAHLPELSVILSC